MRWVMLLPAMLLACMLPAQVQLERDLVSCGGALSSAGNIQLSQTLGDLVVTAVPSTQLIVTQGFQQTQDFSTAIADARIHGELLVFPNPTRDILTVQWTGAGAGPAHAFLQDALGRPVWQSETPLSSAFVLDLSANAAGTYFLHFIKGDGAPLIAPVQFMR